jgi:hypothetical protein
MRGAARERTPERSSLSVCASRRGRRWRYSSGGEAKGGARASTAERLPAGHGGGGDSSPELLVDGEGEKNWISGGVLRRGEGSSGRRRSCDGEEGEGARLNVPQKKKRQEGARAPLTVDEHATAEAAGQRRWCTWTVMVNFRHGRRRGSDSGRRSRDTGARSRQRP